VTLVAISCYFVFDDTFFDDTSYGGEPTSSFVYFGTELGLLSVLFVVVVAAGVKFQTLRFVRRDAESLLDRSLLVVGVFGVMVLECFHLVSAFSYITTGGLVTAMWAGTAVLSCSQVGLCTADVHLIHLCVSYA